MPSNSKSTPKSQSAKEGKILLISDVDPNLSQPQGTLPIKLSSEQMINILLAEYQLLQQQSEFSRQSRDTRVNWYTAIIGGALTALGLFVNKDTLQIFQPAVIEFIVSGSLALLVIVGIFAFEAAQRYNLNDIVSRLHMKRIRLWLCSLQPELDRKLEWGTSPNLKNFWPLWIPNITVTINCFVISISFGLLFMRIGLPNGLWQLMGIGVGVLGALGQIIFAWNRYKSILNRFDKTPQN